MKFLNPPEHVIQAGPQVCCNFHLQLECWGTEGWSVRRMPQQALSTKFAVKDAMASGLQLSFAKISPRMSDVIVQLHRLKDQFGVSAAWTRLRMRSENGLLTRCEAMCMAHLLQESMIICLVTG